MRAIDADLLGLTNFEILMCNGDYKEALKILIDKIEHAPTIELQPKKKLTFTERQKITQEYHEWCLINNALDCAESFLAFMCIKGYV